MGGKRSVRKPRPKKNSGKKNTRKKETGKKNTGKKENSVKRSNFHTKYNDYVTKLANKLDIHPNEASSHLGTAMQNAFNGLMLSKFVGNVSNDEYYSLKEDELQSTLHPSIGATKKRKKKKCKSCGASGIMSKINRSRGKCSKGKCNKCGKMKLPLSLLRNMRSIRKPGNKRTFHLTPKSLRHDNIKTNMSGYSETRICESHNGSPLKCRTIRKRY